MRMRDYPFVNYGIVFGETEIEYAAQVIDIDTDDIFEFAEDIGLQYIPDFQGEAVLVTKSGYADYDNAICFYNDVLFYAPIDSRSTLFKAAYSSMDELIEVMKNRYGKYLPTDYDYKSNIREITGTYYG